ncbi:RagB/SusD family nutrient uptake outer membrane protein [Panacibacter sp. DH6]|uniref:RagB/SusD family nutrient uptake outer membrane protein n=1 Tax=Panacibacter microcysteis TaxID=2793269 RepID=A0A931H014_9BACT|nr:RagB/SusD family nutrient uptake outer membrane protein [Panacibacter microcysteis]MBG9378521.1 RagB/SusD family nutrient uptake outer membrane protein [Panacibacter microcysteis]
MKKYSLFLCVALAGITILFSCSKTYEPVPVEQVTGEYIWDPLDSNGNYANQYLTGIYALLPNGYNRIGSDYLDAASDDAIPSRTSVTEVQKMLTGGITIFDNPDAGAWANAYTGIRRCTDFLNNFGIVPLKSAYEKRSRFGEARVMRAFFYWELVRRWGGVAIVGDSVKGLEDNVEIPRSSFARCVDYIVTECDRAIDSLRTDPVDDINLGRWSQAGAMALKAQVLLFAASPLYNGNEIGDTLNGYPTYDANRWQLAANAAKQVMDIGVYQLDPDFRSVFISQRNNEIIFAKLQGRGRSVENQNGPPNFSSAPALGYTSPTQELVDAYGMANGKPITDPASGYDANNPYANRDPRFYATILYNGAPWLNTTLETFVGGLSGPGASAGTQTKTGYYTCKFMADYSTQTQYGDSYHDWIYFRYADILLSYAEALNEFSGPGTEVYTAVEAVRSRAGLNPFTLDAGLSKEQMRDIIRNERRKEFAFEEHRFWDIRRWKIAEQVYADPLHGMSIIKNASGSFTYNIEPVIQPVFMAAKDYYYPVPYNEMISNSNMRQNPGW